MNGSRGQSLLELAVCLPVVLALALGTAAVVRVVDGYGGLEAATQAAVNAAARQPDAGAAAAAAQAAFRSVTAAYPLRSASLSIDVGDFNRGAVITATASATIDVGWPSLALPAHLELRAHATAHVESWRSGVGA